MRLEDTEIEDALGLDYYEVLLVAFDVDVELAHKDCFDAVGFAVREGEDF